MIEEALKGRGGATAIHIMVKAGASTEGIEGFDRWRGRIVVRTSAKAVEGRANRAIVRLFSRCLELPPRDIRITAGEKSTLKTLEVGMDMEGVMAALQSILGEV
ncbi:MAG: DUF167 domain-containing protein [Methanobacteriota archaeon]|nr:MAG: DUF167 domain-containing protein [Euryarchaeota archaeon]